MRAGVNSPKQEAEVERRLAISEMAFRQQGEAHLLELSLCQLTIYVTVRTEILFAFHGVARSRAVKDLSPREARSLMS